ncbi:MAG: zinc ribbon domain-containing protein [Acidobacteriota bacterium]|nr:zinc ribbon domain-containing protein [Acidobacteriota bacterium]
MFCPKCGIQNLETGKFCRSCGTDLAVISDALMGKSSGNNQGFGMMQPIQPIEILGKENRKKSSDPDNLWSAGIKNLVMGIGFLIVSMSLLLTNVAGGRVWWWAMLIPAFSLLANAIADISKSKRLEKKKSQNEFQTESPTLFAQAPLNPILPPTQTNYIAPDSRYKTGDLVPPSVAEGTTRHLEINSEGETMTLPKK